MAGLNGCDRVWQAIQQVRQAASQRTTSSRSAKQAQRLQRNREIERRIERDKQDMAATSAELKEKLHKEFPVLFEDPKTLPPLRWDNHAVELEPGARAPPVRGLPRMSKSGNG